MLNQLVRYMPIIKFLKKNKGSVLEVGSGSQGLGKFYHKKFTGLDFTSADYGLEEQKTNKYMHFVKGNCLDMPFDDSSFDVVFSLDMIEHLNHQDRKKAFIEMIRVAKKNIFIAFPCGELAYHFDHMLYFQFKKQNKNIPGWLIEHISLEYPTLDETLSILDNIPNIKWTYEWNSNIWLRSFISYIEGFVRGGNLFGIFLSYIIRVLGFSFNNNYGGYRLFLSIKKGV